MKAVSRAQHLAARLSASPRAAQGLRRLRRSGDSTAGACAASASRCEATSLALRGTHARPTAIELPVYYHWEFSTGPVGDIETLARRLQNAAAVRRRCGADRAASSHRRAIRRRRRRSSPVRRCDPGPHRIRRRDGLARLRAGCAERHLRAEARSDTQQRSGARHAGRRRRTRPCPRSSPPIYGEHPAERHSVEPGRDRLALARGPEPAAALSARGRLGRGSRSSEPGRIHAGRVGTGGRRARGRARVLARTARARRAEERRRRATSTSFARSAFAGGARAGASAHRDCRRPQRSTAASPTRRLPDELFDGSMRRLTSARRVRPSGWRNGANAISRLRRVDRQMVTLVDTFANASRNVQAIDPNRFVPDGIDGQRVVRQDPAAGRGRRRDRPRALHGPARHHDSRGDPHHSAAERAGPRGRCTHQSDTAADRRRAASGSDHGDPCAAPGRARKGGRPTTRGRCGAAHSAGEPAQFRRRASVGERSRRAQRTGTEGQHSDGNGDDVRFGAEYCGCASGTHRTPTHPLHPPHGAARNSSARHPRERYSSSARTRCSRRCRRTRSARAAP